MSEPVTEIIDRLLLTITDCPQNTACRSRLKTIRDSICLELPETRTELLCRVGRAINDGVPMETPYGIIHKYWHDVRGIMERVFKAEQGKQ